MLTGKDKNDLLKAMGRAASIEERELHLELQRNEPFAAFGSYDLRAMAQRRWFLDDRLEDLHAGLTQSVRLSWLDFPLQKDDAYTAIYRAAPALAAGDRLIFDRWLDLVPPRLDDGHRWCVMLHNVIVALGRDDQQLIAAARAQVVKGQISGTDFERAHADIAYGLFENDSALVSSGLTRALEGWARFCSNVMEFSPWYAAIIPIGLYNLGRNRLSKPIVAPTHPRWFPPLPLTTAPGRGLVDFSPISPELEALWRDPPMALTRSPVIKPPPVADPVEEARLLETILASPADDGPREVYADWLLERGLVQGEFIALQLRHARGEKLSKEEKARLQTLTTGAKQWLGSLGPLVSEPQFERGLLAACRAETTTADLRWRTVTSLRGCVPAAETSMPSLVSLSLGTAPVLSPLASLVKAQVPALSELRVLGNARWVTEFEPSHVQAWGVALRALTCPIPVKQLRAFVQQLFPSLESLTVSSTADESWDTGWQLTVTRAKKGLELKVHGPPGPEPAPELLEGLALFEPGSFVRAVVAPETPPVLADVVRRIALSTTEKPVPRVRRWL